MNSDDSKKEVEGLKEPSRLQKMSRKDKTWRGFGEWTNQEVEEVLKEEGRDDDLILFKKFQKIGYEGLEGGNVALMGELPDEFACAANLQREFGRLAPDIHYLPISREDWEAFCKQDADLKEAKIQTALRHSGIPSEE